MSETYPSSDFEINMTLDVFPRVRKFVEMEDPEGWKSKQISLKGFNKSTDLNFSPKEVAEIKELHIQLKKIEQEERRLVLEGKDKPPELVAARKLVISEIDKWKRRNRSAKGGEVKSVQKDQDGAAAKDAESREKQREKVWYRQFAIKRWQLKGLEALIPDNLEDARWIPGTLSKDEDPSLSGPNDPAPEVLEENSSTQASQI
jgi:hypothetical protein